MREMCVDYIDEEAFNKLISDAEDVVVTDEKGRKHILLPDDFEDDETFVKVSPYRVRMMLV